MLYRDYKLYGVSVLLIISVPYLLCLNFSNGLHHFITNYSLRMISILFHLLLLGRDHCQLLARVTFSNVEARKVIAIQTCQSLCSILCLLNRIQMI